MADQLPAEAQQAVDQYNALVAQKEALSGQLSLMQAQGIVWNDPRYQALQQQYGNVTQQIPLAYEMQKSAQNQALGITGSVSQGTGPLGESKTFGTNPSPYQGGGAGNAQGLSSPGQIQTLPSNLPMADVYNQQVVALNAARQEGATPATVQSAVTAYNTQRSAEATPTSQPQLAYANPNLPAANLYNLGVTAINAARQPGATGSSVQQAVTNYNLYSAQTYNPINPNGTVNRLYVPEGNFIQQELSNVKIGVAMNEKGQSTGEYAIYKELPKGFNGETRYTIDPATGQLTNYILIGGGGRNALQSGTVGFASASPAVYAEGRVGQKEFTRAAIVAPGVATSGMSYEQVVAAVKAGTAGEMYSRLGSEAYGGIVTRLDARTLGNITYEDVSNRAAWNLASYVNPTDVNKSKAELPGVNIPWGVTSTAPAAFTLGTIGGVGAPVEIKSFTAYVGGEANAPKPAATTLIIGGVEGTRYGPSIVTSDRLVGGGKVASIATEIPTPALIVPTTPDYLSTIVGGASMIISGAGKEEPPASTSTLPNIYTYYSEKRSAYESDLQKYNEAGATDRTEYNRLVQEAKELKAIGTAKFGAEVGQYGANQYFESKSKEPVSIYNIVAPEGSAQRNYIDYAASGIAGIPSEIKRSTGLDVGSAISYIQSTAPKETVETTSREKQFLTGAYSTIGSALENTPLKSIAGVGLGTVSYAYAPASELGFGAYATGPGLVESTLAANPVGLGLVIAGTTVYGAERAGVLGLTGPTEGWSARKLGEHQAEQLQASYTFVTKEIWEDRGNPIQAPGAYNLPKITDVISAPIFNAPGEGYRQIVNAPGEGFGLIVNLPGEGRNLIAKTSAAASGGISSYYGEYGFPSPIQPVSPIAWPGLTVIPEAYGQGVAETDKGVGGLRVIFGSNEGPFSLAPGNSAGYSLTVTKPANPIEMRDQVTSQFVSDYASKVAAATGVSASLTTPYWWEGARTGARSDELAMGLAIGMGLPSALSTALPSASAVTSPSIATPAVPEFKTPYSPDIVNPPSKPPTQLPEIKTIPPWLPSLQGGGGGGGGYKKPYRNLKTEIFSYAPKNIDAIFGRRKSKRK